jgi:hypothetical protein
LLAELSSSWASTQFQTVRVAQTIPTGGPNPLIEYWFSPGGNCANVVIKWIDRANSTIHILVYSFTLSEIANAIVRAKQRNPNMDIEIAWDKSEVNGVGPQHQKLQNAGINMHIDS